MSDNNDGAKMSRTFDGTLKLFPAFMTWLKGILMYKGIVHIMRASIKSLLPETEMATRQTVEQKQLVKDNQVGMGIGTNGVQYCCCQWWDNR